MAERMNVMIALQTPDGLAFGYVLDASPRHVCFTVNNNLPVGTKFAWRMELKGYSETIMGQLTVTRGHPARSASDWPRYDADITEIPPEDGKLLQVWMEDQEKGGSSRRLEKDPSRFIKDMFSEGMSGASSAQTKLVIERMNERRARREQLFKKTKRGVGGDFGLSREGSTADSASVSKQAVRSRISAALGDFSRRTLAAPEPAQPPRIDPAPAEQPAPPRPTAPEPAPLSAMDEDIIAAALQATGARDGARARSARRRRAPGRRPTAAGSRARASPGHRPRRPRHHRGRRDLPRARPRHRARSQPVPAPPHPALPPARRLRRGLPPPPAQQRAVHQGRAARGARRDLPPAPGLPRRLPGVHRERRGRHGHGHRPDAEPQQGAARGPGRRRRVAQASGSGSPAPGSARPPRPARAPGSSGCRRRPRSRG